YGLTATFSSQQQVVSGTAGTATVLASVPMNPIYWNLSLFGQDAWRPSAHLSLDLGLRWELNPPPTEANGHHPVTVTQIAKLAAMQLAPLGTPLWETRYNSFAPRFGVAYQLFSAPGRETVVRGGVGVFYDTGNDASSGGFNQVFPYASN